MVMKKYFSLVMLAIAAMVAYSCEEELVINFKIKNTQSDIKSLVINAIADDDIAPVTKTTLSGVNVVWATSDVIAGYEGSTKHTSTNTEIAEGGKQASFTFDGVSVDTNLDYLIYPAAAAGSEEGGLFHITIPTNQIATVNSFANGSNVALAEGKVAAETVLFKNLGGLLGIQINNDDIESIKISADEEMTGAGIADPSDFSSIADGGETYVSLTGGLNNGDTYYAVVYPGTYTNLKLVVTKTDGSRAVYTNPNSLTVLRNSNTLIASLTIPNEKWIVDRVFFEERFTEASGTAGWNGGAGGATFVADNDGWVSEKKYAGASCARFGTGTVAGNVTSPSIAIDSKYWGETVNFSFKAGSWSGDATSLGISVDGATISSSSVTLNNASWGNHDLTLTSITKSPITISFTKADRWFLDDVLVYYGEKPRVVTLTVSPSNDVNVTYNSGSTEFSVSHTVDDVANTEWTVSTSSPGFSVEKKGNNSGFIVSYTRNDGEARIGTITVSGAGRTVTVHVNQGAKSWIDVLTSTLIGVSSYADWSDIYSNTDAIYAGNSTKNGSNDIQLRSTNNSGIVSTTSGGVISRVVVTWGTGNDPNGRTLDVYGRDYAYESSSDLYGASKGDLLGSVNSKDGTTTIDVTGSYEYVGLRSNSGALYLADITLTWAELDPTVPKIKSNVATLDWTWDQTSAKTIKVTTNTSAPNSFTVTPTSMSWATVSTVGNVITVTPNATNTSTTDDNSGTITLHHDSGSISDVVVTCTQTKAPTHTISIVENPSSISLSATSGSGSVITIRSNYAWTCGTTGSGFSVSPMSGSEGDTEVTITPSSNGGATDALLGTVTFTDAIDAGTYVTKDVYQLAAGGVVPTGLTASWSYTTNSPISSLSSSTGNTSATITVTNNNSNRISGAAAGISSQKMAADNYWLFTIPDVENVSANTEVTISFSGVKKNNASAVAVEYQLAYKWDDGVWTTVGSTYTDTTTATEKEYTFTPGAKANGTLYIRYYVTSGGSTSAGNHYLGAVSLSCQ